MKAKKAVVKHLKGDIKTFEKEKQEDIELLKKLKGKNGKVLKKGRK